VRSRSIVSHPCRPLPDAPPTYLTTPASLATFEFSSRPDLRETTLLGHAALTDTVVRIGHTSGGQIDKIAAFGLTAAEAHHVGVPLICECHASFECRLYDDTLVDEYNFFFEKGACRGRARAS